MDNQYENYKFNKKSHIKYLKRCLGILPSFTASYDTSSILAYEIKAPKPPANFAVAADCVVIEAIDHLYLCSECTSNAVMIKLLKLEHSLTFNRMTILFFALSGLDILGAIDEVSNEEKKEIIEWIYSLQLTSKDGFKFGGFRGGHCISNLGSQSVDSTLVQAINGNDTLKSDSPNSSNDCNCDSSKQPALDSGHIAMTYSALASLLILGDDLSRVDRRAVLRHVTSLQCNDGSFYSNAGGSENDLRFVYCATVVCSILGDMTVLDRKAIIKYITACLSFQGALGQGSFQEGHGGSTFCGVAALHLLGELDGENTSGLSSSQKEALVRWLVFRQQKAEELVNVGARRDDCDAERGGLQGRPNKPADSCYTFWIGATLKLLGCGHLLSASPLRQFVLSTQDPISGGFAKYPFARPDGLHTFLSISGLSVLGLEEDLLPVHPALNITMRAFKHLQALSKEEGS